MIIFDIILLKVQIPSRWLFRNTMKSKNRSRRQFHPIRDRWKKSESLWIILLLFQLGWRKNITSREWTSFSWNTPSIFIGNEMGWRETYGTAINYSLSECLSPPQRRDQTGGAVVDPQLMLRTISNINTSLYYIVILNVWLIIY